MPTNQEHTPPKILNGLINRFMPGSLHEEFLGDLEEIYKDRLFTQGKLLANIMYWVDTLHLLVGFATLNHSKISPISTIMFNHYFITAYRNFVRQWIPSIVKTVGLSIGLATCILIMIYVKYEWSFDRFHKYPEQVYRLLISDIMGKGTEDIGTIMPTNIMPHIQDALQPGASATVVQQRTSILEKDGIIYDDIATINTDTSFFDVFTFPSLDGNALSLTSDPTQAIITTSLAQKLFQATDPVGEMFAIQGFRDTTSYLVTGVIQDVPQHSHIQFDLVVLQTSRDISDEVKAFSLKDGWSSQGEQIYVRVPEEVSQAQLNEDLASIIRRFEVEDLLAFDTQRLTDIHLKSAYLGESQRGNIKEVYIFLAIACLILFIGLINYTLIVQADFTRRIREIGIRKSSGAARWDIVYQFLSETGIYILFSFPLVVILVISLLPAFSTLMERSLSLDILSDGWIILLVPIIVIITMILGGILPAWKFARIQVTDSIKNQSHPLSKKQFVNKGLLIAQFFITISLISCLGILYRQIHYTQTKDLGFERDEILIMRTWRQVEDTKPLEEMVNQHPDVLQTALSHWTPGAYLMTTVMGMDHLGDSEKEKQVTIQFIYGDKQIIPTLGLQLIQGENFRPLNNLDSLDEKDIPIIINELLVKKFQLENPIGYQFDYGSLSGTVVGVVKNFNMKDLYVPVLPTVIQYREGGYHLFVNYKEGKESNILSHLNEIWPQFALYGEPDYIFLDDHLDTMYGKEHRLMNIVGWFSGIAIVLASLGVFGLAAFAAERRTKEIGIRKVLGASIRQILLLLNKDFIPLLFASIILAVPVSILLMRRWLDQFAYKIEIGPWEFVLALFFVLSIVLLTVSLRSLRAALANPVDALRQE